MTEAEIRIGIVKALRTFGVAVWDMEQNRPTRQTAGFPDIFWAWPEKGWIGFWEVKKPNGQRSAAQRDFALLVEGCSNDRVDYFVPRSVTDAVDRLAELGMVRVN